MFTPILSTKLFAPPPRTEIVLRSSLIERLNQGLLRRLTLVSAPAGFGKTTLVSQWAAGCERRQPRVRVAWLSLDEGDNNLTGFLTCFIAALQTIEPKIGDGALSLIQSPQPLPVESVLTTLLNNISAIPGNFILVLDDYHVVEAQPVDNALTFVLEHLPPQMHLVIATREDPHLPIARLRARGQLTELRAADLRFTPSEAAEFLNDVMRFNLSADDIARLEARTEGWIVGLQLAALSLQSREDTAGFIQEFAGSHRYVLDYLVEEVLQHQPEHIRSFLLQTSVLDRLCGPLCNAVTAQGDGREMLETLERNNLFVVPLDDQRQWYRYHHLFTDVLRTHLLEAQPGQISCLHQRASAWYEQNGFPPDAIRHALAAGDFERAAGLIELAWSAMDVSYQSATWLGWVKALPDTLVRTRPVLSMGYGWALLDGGQLESSEARLQDAELWLDTPTDKMVVVDKVQFQSLPASIATARAYRSLALGDIPGSVKYARRALELTPEDDRVRHNQATSLLGLAQYSSGDLEAAERSLTCFHAFLEKTGEISTLIGITFLLANIRVTLGHLRAAESIYRQSLLLADGRNITLPPGTADLYRGLAEICIEQGDLDAAGQHLLISQKLGELTAPTDWLHRLYVSRARLKEAQGDLAGASSLLDKAERAIVRGPLPDVRPVAALKAQIWIKQGKSAEAMEWALEQGLTVNDELRFTREFEHITLARMLIAEGKSERKAGSLDEATRLLQRLLQAAETGGRMGSAIQVLLLQALAFQAQSDTSSALTALERALALAGPEGYVRIFADEGEAMRSLIEKVSRNPDHPLSGYADKLLAAFAQPPAAPKTPVIRQKSDIMEPLSERELEVLKLLRSELSGPEIARQMIVSLNTLRTHTKNIFNKLGVNNRRAAIRRAHELHLF
jgi:LuxR family transcriptional regulator, maltose regulon positive regulatory protein